MILRNSLLSILRVKGKTALFTLLLFALTLAFALGVGVWASVAQFWMTPTATPQPGWWSTWASATRTIPAETRPCAQRWRLSTLIEQDDAVRQWDASTRSLSVDGFWRSDMYMPDRMFSVLVVGNVYFRRSATSTTGS